MPEKLPSEIIKIELDDATFRGTHVVIEINYAALLICDIDVVLSRLSYS